jgi:hypothetical protein
MHRDNFTSSFTFATSSNSNSKFKNSKRCGAAQKEDVE